MPTAKSFASANGWEPVPQGARSPAFLKALHINTAQELDDLLIPIDSMVQAIPSDQQKALFGERIPEVVGLLGDKFDKTMFPGIVEKLAEGKSVNQVYTAASALSGQGMQRSSAEATAFFQQALPRERGAGRGI